jgi:hypothetical protein
MDEKPYRASQVPHGGVILVRQEQLPYQNLLHEIARTWG